MGRAAAVLGLMALAGCAAGLPAPTGPPDPAVEARLVQATRPEAATHATFTWRLVEADARFSGRGVARLGPPYRARLDLFGPRGELYLSAVLVDRELRLVAASQATVVPPATLLWSLVGVLLPPAGTELTGTTVVRASARLAYSGTEGEWLFVFEGDRLRGAEFRRGNDRHTVELEPSASAELPGRATYRDWSAYRELALTLEEARAVEDLPEDTWLLPGS